jgi:transposase InsO family protein
MHRGRTHAIASNGSAHVWGGATLFRFLAQHKSHPSHRVEKPFSKRLVQFLSKMPWHFCLGPAYVLAHVQNACAELRQAYRKLQEARAWITRWIQKHNHHRPHRDVGNRTPHDAFLGFTVLTKTEALTIYNGGEHYTASPFIGKAR